MTNEERDRAIATVKAKIAVLHAKRNRLCELKALNSRVFAEVDRGASMLRMNELMEQHRQIREDPLIRSELEDGLADFERRRFRKRIRRLALLLLVLGGFVEIAGVPYLRASYEYRGSGHYKQIHRATYVSVTGARSVRAGQYAEGCPIVLLIPLERSLLSYGKDAALWGWNQGSAWAREKWEAM